MRDVLVWFPNSAVDHTVHVRGLRLGDVQKAVSEHLSAGGKGANVLRSLATLGCTSAGVTTSGPIVGSLHELLTQEMGVTTLYTRVVDDTRIATLIIEDGQAAATVVNGPGPALAPAEWQEHVRDVKAAIDDHYPKVVAICGSFPPNADPDDLIRICDYAKARNAMTLVDVSGELLQRAVEANVDLIKVNRVEAAEVVSLARGRKPLPTAGDKILESLAYIGANRIVITDGNGPVLATFLPNTAIYPPQANFVSDVGCGDAFLAALAAQGVATGTLDEDHLRWATAVAAASAETPIPGAFDLDRARILLRDVRSQHKPG